MDFRLTLYKHRFLAYLIFIVGFGLMLVAMLFVRSTTRYFARPVTTTPTPAQYFPGQADEISDYLFQGQYIPGWSPQGTPVPEIPQTVPPPFAITQAKIYLIQYLEQPGTTISLDSLTVVSTTKAVWLDNQLGCASGGEISIADNVPGWIIVIKYPSNNNRLYVFHTNDSGSQIRLCQVMIS